MLPSTPVPAERHSPKLAARLLSGAAAFGIAISDEQLRALFRYLDALSLWSARMNLTAVRDPDEVIERHFLDSLALVARLPGGPRSLVDVGSGAGFPGVLCALFRPDLSVTLVERVGKKSAFLLALRRELGLRYEVEARDATQLPGGYGIAVSRAALPLPRWFPVAHQLVAPGGWVFAMTTPQEPLPKLEGLVPALDLEYELGDSRRRLLAYTREA